eukprot:5285235-Prymnesium_polylepis.1
MISLVDCSPLRRIEFPHRKMYVQIARTTATIAAEIMPVFKVLIMSTAEKSKMPADSPASSPLAP